VSTADPDKWTRERAEQQAEQIRAYWQARGCDIDVWVEPVSKTYATDFAVRSSLRIGVTYTTKIQ